MLADALRIVYQSRTQLSSSVVGLSDDGLYHSNRSFYVYDFDLGSLLTSADTDL